MAPGPPRANAGYAAAQSSALVDHRCTMGPANGDFDFRSRWMWLASGSSQFTMRAQRPTICVHIMDAWMRAVPTSFTHCVQKVDIVRYEFRVLSCQIRDSRCACSITTSRQVTRTTSASIFAFLFTRRSANSATRFLNSDPTASHAGALMTPQKIQCVITPAGLRWGHFGALLWTCTRGFKG